MVRKPQNVYLKARLSFRYYLNFEAFGVGHVADVRPWYGQDKLKYNAGDSK